MARDLGFRISKCKTRCMQCNRLLKINLKIPWFGCNFKKCSLYRVDMGLK